jgi:hypothetical protein
MKRKSKTEEINMDGQDEQDEEDRMSAECGMMD